MWARSADHKGVKWIARTPPKRQAEGSNPSGPGLVAVLIYVPNICNSLNNMSTVYNRTLTQKLGKNYINKL